MKNIIVIQSAKLGDMVCTTPVFRAIKETYPEATLFVMGDSANQAILIGNPHVSRYLPLEEASRRLFKELELDAAVLLTPNPEILTMLVLARVSKIVVPRVVGGFSPFSTLRYKLLLPFVTVVTHRFGHYAPSEYLRTLEPLGIVSRNTKKELFLSPKMEKEVEVFLSKYRDKRFVGIVVSAGNKIKEWPPERFAAVADEIAMREGIKVLLIGGPKDGDIVAEVLKHSHNPEVLVSTQGLFNIGGLSALISRLELLVGVDTGPIYMAEALGVATVDIVGPMDEREQPPRGDRHRVVFLKDRKESVLHIMNARIYDEQEARRQVDGISVEMVMMEINSILN